jgi:signal transduction histidine kinase
VTTDTPPSGNTPFVAYFDQLQTPAIEIDMSTEKATIRRVNQSFHDKFEIEPSLVGESASTAVSIDSVPLNTIPHSTLVKEKTQEVDLVTQCESGTYLRTRIFEPNRIIDTYLPAGTKLPHHRHVNILHRIYRHNLRNGVNAIKGWAEVITSLSQSDSESDSEKIQEMAQTIVDRSQELDRISDEAGQLKQLLEKHGEFKSRPLTSVFADVLPNIESQFTTSNLSVNISSGLTVYCNNTLPIAFDNLLDNAFRHNPADVEVTVDATNISDSWTEVCVTDTGRGIPQTERGILTDPHSIDQINHGNGLGLWLTRWVFDQHNVRDVSVDTGNTVGSAVRVVLPSIPDTNTCNG